MLFSSNIYVNADELFNVGKEVFLGAGNCAACHMLTDAQYKLQLLTKIYLII